MTGPGETSPLHHLPYTLAKDGDGPEKRWFRPPLADLFPSYEMLWSRCIVPLTYRVVNRDVILVRFTLEPESLQYFASAHHGVFYRLGLAAQEYQDKATLVRPEGLLQFYLHLHTAVGRLLDTFLRLAGTIHDEFLGIKLCDLESWAGKWKSPHLVTDRNKLVQEIKPYRDHAAHFLPVIIWRNLAPSPTFLKSCQQKSANGSPTVNLAQMARMIMDKGQPDDYVEIGPLTDGHFTRCLSLCNEIWTYLHRDFCALVETEKFKDAVRPSEHDELFVSRFLLSAPNAQGSQGHQGFQGLFPEHNHK